ncbi:MAG: amidohydrolase family protein [Lautropia sp.]
MTPPDLLIRGGSVVDGSGAPARRADVAVAGGRIVAVADELPAPAAQTIDAAGLTVAPGFIDIHSHSDYTLLVDPRAVSAIAQGVTLEVLGNCGFGCAPIKPSLAAANIYGFNGRVALSWTRVGEYLDELQQRSVAVNTLTLVPNGQLRRAVVGVVDRPADSDEVRRMNALLEQGLDEGAFGWSTGLEYPAERAAGEAELTALAGTVARRGGLYATHTRQRDEGAIAAIDEAVRTAEASGVRLQLSHLLPRRTRDGEDLRAIERMERARRRGLDLRFDMHTRLYGTTFLHTIIPPWADERGGAAALLRSAQGRASMRGNPSIVASGGWERVVLLDHPAFPRYSRRSFGELGRKLGRDPFDIACDILEHDLDDLSRAMVIIRAYTPDQQARVFAHPMCMPGSDATTLAPDGPLAGAMFHGAYSWAAWFFDFMVRQRRLLSVEEAVHRLTGFPADTLGLRERGRIAVGMAADLAVFDAASFRAQAETFEPNRLATGMRHVIVNGVSTLRDGVLTGRRAGQVIRRGGP